MDDDPINNDRVEIENFIQQADWHRSVADEYNKLAIILSRVAYGYSMSPSEFNYEEWYVLDSDEDSEEDMPVLEEMNPNPQDYHTWSQ